MGCNGSKRDDVDRERRSQGSPGISQDGRKSSKAAQPQPIAAAAPNEIPRSVNRAIQSVGSPKAVSGSVDGVYGTSYTNRKTQEYDLLHEIVQATRSNFIDVAAKAEQMDDEDIQERASKYQKQILQTPQPVAAVGLSGSLAAPGGPAHPMLAFPQGLAELGEFSSHLAPIAAADLEFIQSAAQSLSESLSRASVGDRGKLVKSFEEL